SAPTSTTTPAGSSPPSRPCARSARNTTTTSAKSWSSTTSVFASNRARSPDQEKEETERARGQPLVSSRSRLELRFEGSYGLLHYLLWRRRWLDLEIGLEGEHCAGLRQHELLRWIRAAGADGLPGLDHYLQSIVRPPLVHKRRCTLRVQLCDLFSACFD